MWLQAKIECTCNSYFWFDTVLTPYTVPVTELGYFKDLLEVKQRSLTHSLEASPPTISYVRCLQLCHLDHRPLRVLRFVNNFHEMYIWI